jgi:hypothetical protein
VAQITSNRTDACILNGAAYGHGFGALLPDGSSTHLRGREMLTDWFREYLGNGKQS